ncbi:hypothetical protein SDC9_165534 [bioreactor metagenome]|uniref:Cytochrome b5 heme-binding domain-containing protein n=1 Tax=bioreactor metagenome TaxID=1076179 RepID=A0A645FWE6_9ZZZZ
MHSIVQRQIDGLLYELNFYTELLYTIPCTITRNIIINQIRNRLSMLNFLTSLSKAEAGMATQITGVPALTQLPQQGQKTFTSEELSRYNGKNGNPAYVAVNRVVYDVTNNAAWAAATHVGLSAGRDLTQEFASCHNGQKILDDLTIVGRLI